jgi:endonuclease/exonuclease/phosphatase family metal-dependent hydrolase
MAGHIFPQQLNDSTTQRHETCSPAAPLMQVNASASSLLSKRIELYCAAVLCCLLFLSGTAEAETIKIATYNVGNLFDSVDDGNEYPEYDPAGPFGWDRSMADTKAANIARVLTALKADIVCLQEVESRRALDLLLNQLKSNGNPYPYSAIADLEDTAVRCAVISTCPITDRKEVSPGGNLRSILQVTVHYDHRPLVLFINHWKSKQGPESRRVAYARALKNAIDRLPPGADYIVAGDFNSNYDEFITLPGERSLNDTNGLTGINHVLGTIAGNRLTTEADLTRPAGKAVHYNLWLELSPDRRWSYLYFDRKNSPDSFILPRTLYDGSGIDYVDNSFDRFDPGFLFDDRQNIYRWQRADRGRGRHLGRGYSDHLPVFALFSTQPFRPTAGGREKAAGSP